MRQTLANQLALIIAVIIVFLAVIFSWFQSTGIVGFVPGPPEEPAQLIPHAVFGFQACRNCHDLESNIPFPPDHVSYSDSVCTGCHIPSGEKIPPHELRPLNIFTLMSN
jgi:hypothetical protein